MLDFLPIFFLAAVSVAAIGHMIWFAKAWRKGWSEVARRLDLEFGDSPALLRGEVGGVLVEVTTLTRGSGKSKRIFTVFDAALPGAPVGAELTLEGLGSKFLKAVNLVEEVEIGDPDFDKKFIIKGADPAALEAWLRPQTKAALVRLQQNFVRVEVAHGRVRAEVAQHLRDADALEAHLRKFARFADGAGARDHERPKEELAPSPMPEVKTVFAKDAEAEEQVQEEAEETGSVW